MNHEWLEALHSVPLPHYRHGNTELSHIPWTHSLLYVSVSMYTFHTTNLELRNHKGIWQEHEQVSIIRIIKCAAICITMNNVFLTTTELVWSSQHFQLENLNIPISNNGFHWEPYHNITLTQCSHWNILWNHSFTTLCATQMEISRKRQLTLLVPKSIAQCTLQNTVDFNGYPLLCTFLANNIWWHLVLSTHPVSTKVIFGAKKLIKYAYLLHSVFLIIPKAWHLPRHPAIDAVLRSAIKGTLHAHG